MNDRHILRLGPHKIAVTAFAEHGLYVRRCLTGDAIDDEDQYARAQGGIILPEVLADQSCWVEVLAVGRKVGTKCSSTHAREYRHSLVEKYGLMSARRGVSMPDNIIGAKAFVPLPWPLVDVRVKQTGIARPDMVIEETLPEAWWVPE